MSSPTPLATPPILLSGVFSPLGSQFLSFHPEPLAALPLLSIEKTAPNPKLLFFPKQDRLPCALYLSHGPRHPLQESKACVPLPYSSPDSKDSTTLPHPGSLLLLRTRRHSSKHPEPLRCRAPRKLSLPHGDFSREALYCRPCVCSLVLSFTASDFPSSFLLSVRGWP